jgi:hypothetical protein
VKYIYVKVVVNRFLNEEREKRMRGLLAKVILLLSVTAMTASAVSLNTMLVTRKAMKEPPSLEIILARIGDIYKAQEFTQKILFETPISTDSK